MSFRDYGDDYSGPSWLSQNYKSFRDFLKRKRAQEAGQLELPFSKEV
jgi:hypothetical protein